MSIIVHSLSYTHPDRTLLFQDLHLSVGKSEKASLVGNNGVGKSTLLQLIAGRLTPSAGEIALSSAPYYVPQHMGQYDYLSVAQAVGIADKLQALHAILDGDASAENFASLNDDWGLEERVQAAMAHWQLEHLRLEQPMHTLSGGEKTKVFLAGILMHTPDIVLLDEPSNHLDAASREQLYEFIRRSKETMLMVSHDRTLLNQLDTTLELSKSAVDVYGGNYNFYKEQKQGQLAALQAQVGEQEKTLKQTQQKARDLAEQRQKLEARGKAQQHKKGLPRIVAGNLKIQAQQSSAQQKEVQNEKIAAVADHLTQLRTQIQEQNILRIDLRKSELHHGKILLDARAINYTYGTRMLWQEPLTFQVRSGDRIRIAGNNGSGKTTLLHLLLGSTPPTVGAVLRAEFHAVYLDQEYSLVDAQLSVFEQVQRFNDRYLPEHEVKMLLHYHQFPRESWDRKCAGLSGGEKMKLILCCLVVSNNTPDLLVLDEPTNNLDVHSQEVLMAAVKDFAGSVVVVSHDQYFINAIGVTQHILLSGAMTGV